MTVSIYESDNGLLTKILKHHATLYRIVPYADGGFDLDLKGHFSLLIDDIKNIENEYDCHLRQIFSPKECYCDCTDYGFCPMNKEEDKATSDSFDAMLSHLC